MVKAFLYLSLLCCGLCFFTPVQAGGGNESVKLIYADGKKFDQETYLSWSTEFEKRPCVFVLEASHDGRQWRIRGKVNSHGQPDSQADYKFVDQKSAGYKHYRIVEHSNGMKRVLSQFQPENYTVSVNMEVVGISLARQLELKYSVDQDQELMIRVYNRIGEQVLTKVMPYEKAGEYTYQLNLRKLKPDNYLLVMTQVMLDKPVAEHPFRIR